MPAELVVRHQAHRHRGGPEGELPPGVRHGAGDTGVLNSLQQLLGLARRRLVAGAGGGGGVRLLQEGQVRIPRGPIRLVASSLLGPRRVGRLLRSPLVCGRGRRDPLPHLRCCLGAAHVHVHADGTRTGDGTRGVRGGGGAEGGGGGGSWQWAREKEKHAAHPTDAKHDAIVVAGKLCEATQRK